MDSIQTSGEKARSGQSNRAWLSREVFGWAMFDFANQAFTLVILTAMFQVYFIEHIVAGDASLGRRLWATSGIITQVIILVISPILGAMADFMGAKKRLLFISYLGCVVLTTSMGLVPPGAAAWGMVHFIAAYLFYAAGENLMASFLPELAHHRHMGRVSAFGWTMGYIGGLLCLLGAVGITFFIEGATGYRLVTAWAGLFFLFGALPTFLILRERKQPEPMPQGQTYWTVGFHRLAGTFRSLRTYRVLFSFLLVMTLYFAGVQIIYWFAGTLTKELFEFSDQKMGLFILQITVTAILGAILTGRYQDRIGARVFLLACLIFWSATMITTAFATQEWIFWIVGNAIGLGIGSIGTASRAMVGLLSPPHKAAEFFGFYGLFHKVSAILGLSAVALLEWVFSGDFHRVVAASSGFCILGFFLLLRIDEKNGRINALREEKAHRRRLGGTTHQLPT
jgi:MFS transporter, UMF1 family